MHDFSYPIVNHVNCTFLEDDFSLEPSYHAYGVYIPQFVHKKHVDNKLG